MPTKYPQGRGNDALYGPPFSVCIGFPASSIKMNTKGKIAYLKNMSNTFDDRDIRMSDFFGTSEFLVPMLNGVHKSPLLAYTKAHKILLMKENPSSKVRRMRY